VELTRRQLLAGVGATTLAAAGLYELAERAGRAPSRPAVTARPPEQHVLGGLRVVNDNNVEVVVPPLHHEIVTFRLPAGGPADLRDAQRRLAQALAGLDEDYASSPAGLGVTVGWGLPYFRGPVATPARDHVPGSATRIGRGSVDPHTTCSSSDPSRTPRRLHAWAGAGPGSCRSLTTRTSIPSAPASRLAAWS